MAELSFVMFCGFIIDLLLGDPAYRYHPIRLMGFMISAIEEKLRAMGLNGKTGGVLLVIGIEVLTVAGSVVIFFLLNRIHLSLGILSGIYICYSCLALRDLGDHIRPVIKDLDADDIQGAAILVGNVVGRDTRDLDRPGISRAAIETMAENFVDGFLSPFFWYFVGGLLGYIIGSPIIITAVSFILASKVSSTLDSMVGYKNQRYISFGWAGARLDDLMNFIPARLSLVILFLGSWICRLRPYEGFRAAIRDRLKHESPNSAHPESFVAGVLNVRLGGPTRYRDGLKEKPWLGEGDPDPGPEQVKMTLKLINCSGWVTVLIPIFFLITIHFVLIQ